MIYFRPIDWFSARNRFIGLSSLRLSMYNVQTIRPQSQMLWWRAYKFRSHSFGFAVTGAMPRCKIALSKSNNYTRLSLAYPIAWRLRESFLKHNRRAYSRIISTRWSTKFGTSFGAMMFSLAPDFLSRLLSTDTMWRVTCGVRTIPDWDQTGQYHAMNT